MLLMNPITMKAAASIEAGELCYLPAPISSLAFVAGGEWGKTWIGLSMQDGVPGIVKTHPPRAIPSFGQEWCLEIIPTRHTTSGPIGDGSAFLGRIVMQMDGPHLIVRGSQIESDVMSLNLMTWQLSYPEQRGGYGFDWRLWISPQDRMSPHARPLYEVGYESPEGR